MGAGMSSGISSCVLTWDALLKVPPPPVKGRTRTKYNVPAVRFLTTVLNTFGVALNFET